MDYKGGDDLEDVTMNNRGAMRPIREPCRDNLRLLKRAVSRRQYLELSNRCLLGARLSRLIMKEATRGNSDEKRRVEGRNGFVKEAFQISRNSSAGSGGQFFSGSTHHESDSFN